MANRTVIGFALLLGPSFLWGFACGGGQADRGSAVGSPSLPPAGSDGGRGGEASKSNASTESTTTSDLSDAGAQGGKLPEVQPASPAASASAVPKAPHGHDPGRGPLDIKAIVQAHRDEARACYDRALAEHPGIEGDLVVTWTIDPKGHVTQTAFDLSRSQIAEPSVVNCIQDLIKGITFAPSPGGFETKASYPFNFHPRRAKPSQ